MEKRGRAFDWRAGAGAGLIILGIYLLSRGGLPNVIGGIIVIAVGVALIAGRL